GRNLIGGFRALQEAGAIEIITSGATHGFLPLIANAEARRAQIEVARRNYWKHFGRAPRGIWLPECAYFPGDDAFLAEAGIQFFFVDAPAITPSGVAALARDVSTGERVWSSQIGYPGDPFYREFYRDLGWDLDEEL